MAPDDDAPEYPRWDGAERRNEPALPREVGHYDQRKMQALLECVEFSGVDLLDGDDKIAFTERLARAKRADDRRKQRKTVPARVAKWVMLAVGSGLVTLFGPDAHTWLKAHWP